MTLTPNDYQRGFNDGVAAATTPDPRVTQLVEAARKFERDFTQLVAYSKGVSGLYLNGDDCPWEDLLNGGPMEKPWLGSIDALRTAIKAMEQSDD